MSGVALAVVQPQATCGRCGDCCRNIWSGMHPETAAEGLSENALFISRHWTYKEYVTVSPADAPEDERDYRYRYTCDAFDDATSSCMAHDTRPPICRDFPWYGETPRGGPSRFGPRCSHWLDVPREERPEHLR